MRFERVCGMYVVTCMNLKDVKADKYIGSMHQGESRKSFSDAKRDFWESWREEMPDHYLKPRNDNPLES